MNTKRHLAELILAIMPYAAIAGEVTIPNTFQAGTPAVAAEVNANFAAVEAAVDDNALRLGDVESTASTNASTAQQNAAAIGALEADIQSQAARILDLSGPLPVVIDEPGSYALGTDWTIQSFGGPAIEIRADLVTLDLRGFAIDFGSQRAIVVTGDAATIRNGSLIGGFSGAIVTTQGADSLLQGIRLEVVGQGVGISLDGLRGVVLGSEIVSGDDAVAILARSNSTIQSNYFQAETKAVSFLQSPNSVHVLDNVIACGNTSCISVTGTDNVVARNIITRIDVGPAISVQGDGNLILDNAVLEGAVDMDAMVIDGTRNTLRGNILSPPAPGSADPWNKGIVFLQDANFYGDNLVAATVPFDLGATVQVDLGGNVGL